MIGSIEELEREIEEFQNNIMASGEVVKLLDKMVEGIKEQNDSFEQKSRELLTKLSDLPTIVEKSNDSCISKIKTDVANELDKSVHDFSREQNKYIEELDNTNKRIKEYIENSDQYEKNIDDKINKLLEKFSVEIDTIRNDALKSNEEMKKAIDEILAKRNEEFASEQDKYISSLNDTQNTINDHNSKICKINEDIAKESSDIIEKMNSTINQIREQSIDLSNQIKKENDESYSRYKLDLSQEQKKYIDELDNSKKVIQASTEQLEVKYSDFLNTLKKTNVADIYEQNNQLKSELNKRTIILIVLSVICIIVSIVGLIL